MVELSQRHFQEPKQPLLSAQEISILLNNFSKICAQYQPKDQTEAEILWKYSQYTETQSRTADERIIDIDFIRTQLNIFKNIKDMKQFINGYSMNALVGFDATHSIFLETQERIEAAQKDYILSGDPHELHDAINLVYDWLETSVKSEQFKDYPLFLKGFLQLCRLLKETLGRVFGYETALGKNKASMMGSIAQLINQQPNYDLLQKFLAQESSGLGLKEQQTLLNNVFQQQLDEIKKKQPQKYSQFHHQALSSFQQGLISNASMLQTLDAGIPLYKLFSKEGGKKAQVLEQIKHDNIEQVAISTNGGVVLTFKEPLIYVGDTLNEIEVGSRDIFENSPEFAQKSFQIMVEQFQQGSSLSLADFLNQKSQEIRLASGLESILQSNDQITSARDQVMQLSPQGARAHIDRQLQNEPEDVVLSPEQVQRAKQVIKHLPPQAREALGDFASRFFDEQPQPTQKDLKSLSLFIEYQRENYRHDRRLFDLRKYLKVPEVARKIMEESALQQSVIRKYLQDSQRSEGEQELPTPASLKEFLGNACLESAEPEQYLLQKEVIAALKSNQALLSKPVDYYFEQIFQNEGLKTVIQGIKEESGTEDWLMSCAYEFYINTERDDTSRWERVKDEVFCKAHPDKEAFFELLQHTCIDDIVCDEKGQIKFEEVFAKVPEGSPIYRVLLTDGKHIEFDARSPRSGELRGNNLMRALQDALEQSKDSANHPTISEAITNSQQFQKSIHTAMFNTMSSMILGSKSNQKIFSALPDLTIKLPDVLEQEVGFDEIGIKEVLGKISDPDYYDEVLKLLVCRTLEFTERGFFEKQMQVMQCLLKYEKEHPEVALDDAQRKDTLEELMSCDGCVNFKKIIDKLHNTLSEGVPKIPSHEASRSGEDVRTNLGELKKVDLYQGSYPPGVNKGKDIKLRR